MRLADFIESHMEAIVLEWERFARTLLPASSSMTALALRDHAGEMLAAIAADMRSSQNAAQQQAKAWGFGDAENGAGSFTAAQLHGALRASAGVSIQQLVSEFRAMRASVLRLYAEAAEDGTHTVRDIGRFNEAIDQAIAESTDVFQREVEHWRNVFLGVLQHDLRGPLQALLTSAQALVALPAGTGREQAAARVQRNGERMKVLLDELLDYNRATLNLGLPLHRVPCDLAKACADEVELRRLAHPRHTIEWAAPGPVEGLWDASRIQQALGNLVANAAHHGAAGGTIGVELQATADAVTLVVSNAGEMVHAEDVANLFEPMRRAATADPATGTNLGLGLFVVREIARAHGGDVQVDSQPALTRFCMRLPRFTAD